MILPDNDWMAPAGAKDLKNPTEVNQKTLKSARSVYNLYCKSCHGTIGKGNGLSADNLKVKCADLTSDKVQVQSDGELYYKISIGRNEMPSFKGVISDTEERWLLVNYIRSLKPVEQVNNN